MDVMKECRKALKRVDRTQVDFTVGALREASRIFCVGNGGGYAHAMHFASDLRKIAGKQAFSFDNVAEMTARINDQGWSCAWWEWRNSFGFWRTDADFLFSVGGALDELSPNLGNIGPELGIVGAYGHRHGRIMVPSTSTPVIEGCQSVIAHHIIEELCR